MKKGRILVSAAALGAAGLALVVGPALVGADASTTRGVLWLTGFTQLLWLALAVGLAALAMPATIADRLGLRPGGFRAADYVLAILGMVLLSHGANGILVELQVRDGSTIEQIDRIVQDSRNQAPWLAICALALLPGIAEELLFRGAILEILSERFTRSVGWVGSALLFGAAHLDPVHSTAAFALGLYLGLVALLGGSVWPAIACHLVNNAIAVISQLLGHGAWTGPGAPWMLAVAAGCLALLWWRAGGLPSAPPRSPRGSPPEVDPAQAARDTGPGNR